MNFGARFSKISVKAAVIGLMALMMSSPAFASLPNSFSSAASSTSCPTSDQLNWTLYGGVPTNFNLLGSFNSAGYDTAFMVWPLGISPPPFPNGTLDWQASATDYVTSNSNYTIWYFNARPGLEWSDGQPINASTLLLNFGPQFALNASVDPVNAYQMVSKEYAYNSTEAVFVLNQPEPHFNELLAPTVDTALYPPQFIAQGPTYSGLTNGTLVGDGPWYIGSYQTGSTTLTLLRNPYFTPESQICQVNVNFDEAEASTAQNLISGSSDMAQIPTPDASEILANPAFTVVPEIPGGSGLMDILYNINNYPYNQLGFRQALLDAINQSAIQQDAFFGYSTTAYNAQGFVPTTSQWYDPNQPTYSFNPTESLSLLHSLGYTTSSGILHYPNGTAVTLSLDEMNAYTETTLAASIVVQDLKNIGITITGPTLVTNPQVRQLSAQGALNYSLYMTWSAGAIFGSAFWDAQPSCDAYNTEWSICPTGPDYTNWEGNPTATAEYASNVSAVFQTANVAQETKYLDNIQNLSATNLPELNLQFGQNLIAINTQKFGDIQALKSGWSYFGENWNPVSFADITPVGLLTSTSSHTASSSSSTGTAISSTATSSSTTTTTTLSSSTTTTTTSSSTLLYAGVAVAIIVIIGAIAGVFLSRRKKPAT